MKNVVTFYAVVMTMCLAILASSAAFALYNFDIFNSDGGKLLLGLVTYAIALFLDPICKFFNNRRDSRLYLKRAKELKATRELSNDNKP